jgi:hypothetical protein
MAKSKGDKQRSEQPTPRNNPHSDTQDGETGVPESEQGISNRTGDKDAGRDAQKAPDLK